MPGCEGSIQFSLREPFDRAVASVCRSLTNRGLLVTGQLDISGRVEHSLGIVLPPCRIVFVLPDPSAPGAAKIHPWAAVFLPFHIVISSQGPQTEILVPNRIHGTPETAGMAFLAPVSEMQGELAKAIEAIAMRPSLVG